MSESKAWQTERWAEIYATPVAEWIKITAITFCCEQISKKSHWLSEI